MSNQENPTTTIWFDVPRDGGVHNTTQSQHIFDSLLLRPQNCEQDSYGAIHLVTTYFVLNSHKIQNIS